MKRREFITLLGGTVAWPFAAHAQQPLVGFLHPGSREETSSLLIEFREGLGEAGYAEGRNVTIEYRWADNQVDRLQALAEELVRRQVVVIVAAGGTLPALAAKAATTTIPIVFDVGDDPVKLGLVTSLARPGGNLTGINFFTAELAAKRLELIHELVPAATRVAVLVNPVSATGSQLRDLEAAAGRMGLQIQIINARTSREIDAAFALFAREPPQALFVGTGTFLRSRRVQLVLLATRHAVPAMYSLREYVEVGGLMSYGADLTNTYRQIGVYVARILKGAKPVDLPVEQATKFQLVFNLQAARTLGLDVPAKLLALADEVIE